MTKDTNSKKIPHNVEDIIARVEAAKTAVQKQSKNRLSRRLLLAERAQSLTCVCEATGIVSILQVPAIYGYALTYTHPLSNNSNARGLAQKGVEYLKKLDTQTLAGILITIADSYDLFRYREGDTGAQKNSLLRTAGKDNVINGIVLIERYVHSGNRQFLPKLSLVFDTYLDYTNVESRIVNYWKILLEAIQKPDTSALDLSIKKIGKPIYIKDVEKEQRRISFIARQEIASAKKDYANDKKTAKALLNDLFSKGLISIKMRGFLQSLFSDDSLIAMDAEARQAIAGHEKIIAVPALAPICEMILKDRSKLTMNISEVEEILEMKKQEEIKEEIFSVPVYTSGASLTSDSEENEQLEEGAETEEHIQAREEMEMPEGLSPMEKILWKKKHSPKTNRFTPSQEIEVSHKYIPSETKEKLGYDPKLIEKTPKKEQE